MLLRDSGSSLMERSFEMVRESCYEVGSLCSSPYPDLDRSGMVQLCNTQAL